MRKAEIIIVTIITLLALGLGVAGEKVFWKVKDGECKSQPVLVPVPLDKDCKPNVLIRRCGKASDSYTVDCFKREPRK